MSIRPIRKHSVSQPTIEGAGVRLNRAFGFGEPSEFDPFLLLDDFRNERPEDYSAGFPWHPHRSRFPGTTRLHRSPKESWGLHTSAHHWDPPWRGHRMRSSRKGEGRKGRRTSWTASSVKWYPPMEWRGCSLWSELDGSSTSSH